VPVTTSVAVLAACAAAGDHQKRTHATGIHASHPVRMDRGLSGVEDARVRGHITVDAEDPILYLLAARHRPISVAAREWPRVVHERPASHVRPLSPTHLVRRTENPPKAPAV
jgi:hypothetical protein